LNPDFVGTEPKEAAYAGTGGNAKENDVDYFAYLYVYDGSRATLF